MNWRFIIVLTWCCKNSYIWVSLRVFWVQNKLWGTKFKSKFDNWLIVDSRARVFKQIFYNLSSKIEFKTQEKMLKILVLVSGAHCRPKNLDWNSLRWSSTDHDLNLKFGISVPNNFQNGLNVLVETNPNLNLDDDFYDGYYEDYFNVYWNLL